MPKQILVASPHLAFGELLRLSLEESGQYRVRLAQTSAEARGSAGRAIFSLLILDADLKDCTFAELTREIQEQQSQARLILIPPDNNPQHPALKGLSADAYLNKPFYLPDLMDTVERLMTAPANEVPPEPAAQPADLPEAAPEGTPADVPAPPAERPAWLKNTTGAQRLLDEAVNDSHARAAIVLNGGQVCASSGNLPPAAVQELTEILARTWERHKNYDLARFIRLKEGGEHLLYATSLADQVALALACDVTLPLTRARGKAILLARQLADLPPEEEPAAPVAVAAQPPEPGPVAAQSAPEPDSSEEDLQLEDEDTVEEDDGMEIPDLRLLELLADAPPPNPVVGPAKPAPAAAGNWAPEIAGETAPHALNLPWEQILAQPPARLPDDPPSPYDAPTIAIRRRPSAASDAPTVAVRAQENGNGQPVPQTPAPTELISTPPPPILPASAAPQAAPEAIAAPQPFVDPPPGSLLSVEPVSPTLSHLAYTALLIPRIPQHILVGELSEELGLWVPQLCLAFGWRLEGMSIRPETLQFTLQVAPSVSPGNVVRILRQRTSQRIFSRFPELKELNPSGDFWAPGYLIISGSTPPQPNLLHDFVVQTRRRQGLTVS